MLASSAVGSGGSTLAGSESYNQVIPILSLPGRNGLEIDLALFYSSRVWTIDSANNRVTFNADRDFPSYGFRLGYGYIEVGDFVAILTEPDGTKRRMLNNVTVDSSYIDWNSSTKILRRKDGTQWHYQQVGTSNLYRPIKIQDTNGNFISITYKPEATFGKQAIYTITDTLGRVITFNYDASNRLASITAPAQTTGTRTVITFTWGTTPLTYSFTLTPADTVSSGTSINVLTACTYTNGMKYEFSYGAWASFRK